jgi:outer membrane receptor for ferrienterochelin and colicin
MTSRLILSAVATFAIALAAHAQDAGVSQAGNVTTYDAAFFAPLSPITAEDILNRIPGIQDLFEEGRAGAGGDKDEKRGFGAEGDQILFNGRRLSSKTMSVASALQRIRADQVLRVEVIRGDAAGMDVRSEGVLINVVLADSLSTGSGTWETDVRHFSHIGAKVGGKLTYAGDVGALSYVLGLKADPASNGRHRDGFLFAPVAPNREEFPTTPPIQRLAERHDVAEDNYEATGSFAYTLSDRDVLNANGRLYRERDSEDNETVFTALLSGGVETLITDPTNVREVAEDGYELGADYQHVFAKGDTLKVLGLWNHAKADDVRDLFLRTAIQNFGQIRTQSIFPVADEQIARATWRTSLSQRHSFEFGGEAALNRLNSRIERIDYANGVARAVALFNPTGTVEETRFETFASWSWRPVTGLAVDFAADTESSKFRQRGRDVRSDRSLFFVKPRLDMRYDVAPRNQLRFKASRSVSQLDFADFLPGFNDEPTRVDVLRAGNPNLVPEKRWTYEAVYEYRLADDQGVVSLRGYTIAITDYIEQVPIDLSAVAATGNLGKASESAAEFKAGLRLGFLGLPNATVDVLLQKRRSRVTDPFDGRRRGFLRTQVGTYEIGFRHDTEWRNFAYGFTARNRDHFVNSDADFAGSFNPPLQVEAFAEVKLGGNLLVRLDGERLARRGGHSFRYVYAGRRGVAAIDRIERSEVKFPQRIRLSLRGTY